MFEGHELSPFLMEIIVFILLAFGFFNDSLLEKYEMLYNCDILEQISDEKNYSEI